MNYSAPTYVPIEITSRCNLRCKHCYGEFPRKDRHEMSFSDIKMIIDKLYNAGVFRFEIGGGEPSLRSDFVDILEIFGAYKGIAVTVVTNGIAYTDEMIERISRIPTDICFHISVDGYDDETYAFLRGNRMAFHTVVENSRKMIEKGLNIRWNFAVGKQTVSFLPDTIKLAESVGIKSIRLMVLYNTGRAKEDSLGFDYNEFQDFLLSYINGEYSHPVVRVTLALTQPFEYAIPLLEKGVSIEEIKRKINYESCMDDLIYNTMTDTSCTAGRTLAAIDSEGNLHYCCMLTGESETIGGNLLREDFAKVWNNSEKFNWIRSIRLDDLNTNCYTCEYKEICGGGCRARALYATGDILGPDPLCPFAKYEKKDSVSRGSNENEWLIPEVFNITIGNITCRVREEFYGATVYTTNDKYFNLGHQAFLILKMIKKYGNIGKVIEVLHQYNEQMDVNIFRQRVSELVLQLLS